jgi:hypothetical protein
MIARKDVATTIIHPVIRTTTKANATKEDAIGKLESILEENAEVKMESAANVNVRKKVGNYM